MTAEEWQNRVPVPDVATTALNLPREALSWIVRTHQQYMDALFYDIKTLTNYLATCRPIEVERIEFIRFVDSWAYRASPDLDEYVHAYRLRYEATKRQVLAQCARIVGDDSLWEPPTWREFWGEYASVNEYDNLHGMFLTSGRWYTNVAVVPIRVLAQAFLEDLGEDTELAPSLAFEVVSPLYAVRDERPPRAVVTAFSRKLRSILLVVDEPVLERSALDYLSGEPWTADSLLDAFLLDPGRFERSTSVGVFPPFAVQELDGSGTSGSGSQRGGQIGALAGLSATEAAAVQALKQLKFLEADYNRFNYKGYFPLVSKYFYWNSIERGLIRPEDADGFRAAVLGDRFYEALSYVERSVP